MICRCTSRILLSSILSGTTNLPDTFVTRVPILLYPSQPLLIGFLVCSSRTLPLEQLLFSPWFLAGLLLITFPACPSWWCRDCADWVPTQSIHPCIVLLCHRGLGLCGAGVDCCGFNPPKALCCMFEPVHSCQREILGFVGLCVVHSSPLLSWNCSYLLPRWALERHEAGERGRSKGMALKLLGLALSPRLQRPGRETLLEGLRVGGLSNNSSSAFKPALWHPGVVMSVAHDRAGSGQSAESRRLWSHNSPLTP